MLDIVIVLVLLFGIWTFYFAPWVPTKSADIERLFHALNPSPTDVFYDLGCGDGRLVFYFAKKWIQSRGFEISLFFYLYCQIKKWLIKAKNVDFIFWDFSSKKIEKATIVYLFWTNKTLNENVELKKKLQNELKSGTKIISYLFSIDWLELIEKHKDPNGMSIYIYKL